MNRVMVDSAGQEDLLNGILQVLQRIETKLETHEARVKSVEDLIHRHHVASTRSEGTSHYTLNASSDVSSHPRTDDSFTPRGHDSNPPHNRVVEPSTKSIMDRQAVSVFSRGGPKIEYSEWHPGRADDAPMNAQDEAEFSLRTKHLGHCALLPDDRRLPLNFHRNLNLTLGMVEYVDALTRARMLEALRFFDTEHRMQPDNDFCVVDFDSYNNSRIYRVGEDAIGNELMVTTESTYEAPWSRLILYQGMTSGNSIKGEFDSGFADPIRYFQRAGASPGLWDHIFSHLRLKRRSSTANPYLSGHQGFHTIFYDIRETKQIEAKELWKHGPLYDHPLGWYVRKCAYTWESYRSALPVLENDLDNIQLRNAERQCGLLQNQREYFRQKLASTRALRDALFSASAVIESRASTRLGENVKLLTFVSVFFIPLSFCTSLWSINSMFSSNSLIAVIIVVALLTYTTVLNINSIVHSVSILYDTKKRRVINAMKRDERESWRYCGQRFESFRPKHENPKPSEWYVTLYALLNPAAVLGLPRRSKYSGPNDAPDAKPPARFFGIPNGIWRRRKAQVKDSELPDEPWVL
ncbi:MAG: hypothetical protein Q9203_002471 [Teloschistes exilis]